MRESHKLEPRCPAASAGAGDISERELSRERSNLFTPPNKRFQRANPKKQLFCTPVNKFTATSSSSSLPRPNLARIRSCLNEYKQTPRKANVGPKAASMEDLTPTKRIKREKALGEGPSVGKVKAQLAPLHGKQEAAAARVRSFMLVSAWRRRREEVRCVRKTLEFQVSCSERLRIQVFALKSLLESDSAKVCLAMRELERLKQLLKDKDVEKAVLEKEKLALEQDVCAAEDRASEMSIGWRNCRNELECVRAACACCERALAAERAAAADARHNTDRAYIRISTLEEELSQHSALLSESDALATALRRELEEQRCAVERTTDQLRRERECRERSGRECSVLHMQVALGGRESAALSGEVEQLRAQLARVGAELDATREQLDWWPRPLTRMLGAARWWLRRPSSLPDALLWSLLPARHGC